MELSASSKSPVREMLRPPVKSFRLPVLALVLLSMINSNVLAQAFLETATQGIPPLSNSRARWADFNNDDRLDLFLSGQDSGGEVVNAIYFHQGNNSFSKLLLPSLKDIAFDFADFNHDGWLDILMCGSLASDKKTYLLKNEDGIGFTSYPTPFEGVSRGDVLLTDLNNDLNVDVVIQGLDASNNEQTLCYKYVKEEYIKVPHPLPLVSNGKLRVSNVDNDQYNEVIITGLTTDGLPVLEIFSIDEDFNFTKVPLTLQGLAFHNLLTADFNDDGFEDFCALGLHGAALVNTSFVYINNKFHNYLQLAPGFADVMLPAITCGDMNHDGRMDVILSGVDDFGDVYFNYYKNEAGLFAAEQSINIKPIYNGDLALADYDNDLDLDVFSVGNSINGLQANLYQSNQSLLSANSAPTVPQNLASVTNGNAVYLSWESAADDHTSNNSLKYNLVVSKLKNGDTLVFSPQAGITSGFLRNLNVHASSATHRSVFHLPEGKYYWSVQAIDNSFASSPFAKMDSFSICEPITLGVDKNVCRGKTLELNAGDGGDFVMWSTSAGLSLINSTVFNHPAIATDTIMVSVTKSFQCTVYDTLIVNVLPSTITGLVDSVRVCKGSELSFDVSTLEPKAVVWYQEGDQMTKVTSTDYTMQVETDGKLIVEIIDKSQCLVMDTIIFNALPLPDFSKSIDVVSCKGSKVELELPESLSFNWYSKAKGLVATDTNAFQLIVDGDDDIVISGMNVAGCISYDSIVVTSLALPILNGLDSAINGCVKDKISLQLDGKFSQINWKNSLNEILASNIYAYDHLIKDSDTLFVEVTDSLGCQNEKKIFIGAMKLPVVDLGTDMSRCINENILLKAGSGFKQVDWYRASDTNPLATNSWFLNYHVMHDDTIVVSVEKEDGCVNYDSVIVKANPLPVHNIGNDIAICDGSNVNLSVGSKFSGIEWHSNANVILSIDSSFTFVPQESLTVWSIVTNFFGCMASDTLQIELLPRPYFELSPTKTFCYGAEVHLGLPVAASSKHLWERDNAKFEGADFTFLALSSSSVKLTVTDSLGCTFSDSTDINVLPLPTVEIAGPINVCQGDVVKLSLQANDPMKILWLNQNNEIVDEGTTELDMTAEKSETISALVTDYFGCVGTGAFNVMVFDRPQADGGKDVEICFGQDAQLGAEPTSGYYYSWTPSSFLDNSEVSDPTATGVESVLYVLRVTNEHGCNSFDSVRVKVNPKINVDAGTDKVLCSGQSTNVGGNPTAKGSHFNYSYEWYAGDKLLDSKESNPLVSPTMNTMYYVIVSSGPCQVMYDSVNVIVNPLPNVSATSESAIGIGSSVQLFASGAEYYSWLPQDVLDFPLTSSPVANLMQSTEFTVTGFDVNNCSDTAKVRVVVKNTIFVPSLFTPNGDGVNDVFKLFGCGLENLLLTIFDYQGNLVFESSDISQILDNGWDGTHNGKVLANDVYVWNINGNFVNGEPVHFEGKTSGTIRVMR
jgi:gliding motility-associated-like protein